MSSRASTISQPARAIVFGSSNFLMLVAMFRPLAIRQAQTFSSYRRRPGPMSAMGPSLRRNDKEGDKRLDGTNPVGRRRHRSLVEMWAGAITSPVLTGAATALSTAPVGQLEA